MISGIIKVEVSVISRSRRLRLITLTETLIIPDITKTESNNCFIIQAILIFYYRSHSYFTVRELDIAVRIPFVSDGNFQVQAPRGLIFGCLIFGGAYRWRGLFSEFYGS